MNTTSVYMRKHLDCLIQKCVVQFLPVTSSGLLLGVLQTTECSVCQLSPDMQVLPVDHIKAFQKLELLTCVFPFR